MTSIDVQCAVVGGGVVGLAVARCLALRGIDTVLLEAETELGTKTSSRNSEVIHAGIYYPAGSLKAVHCVRGREMLYQYCEQHDIPHRRCGKLIVANGPGQESTLKTIESAAKANGVADIASISAAEVKTREPAIHASAALFSPSTGIIDSHQYMQQLATDVELAGGMLLRQHAVLGGHIERASGNRPRYQLDVDAGGEQFSLDCRMLVNCAALDATGWLARVEGFEAGHIPPMYFAKGNYFSLQSGARFRHLVYPLPGSAGLGTHLTLDLQGRARFGPDVQWIDSQGVVDDRQLAHRPHAFDYRVDESRREAFCAAIADYYPAIEPGMLVPDYSGIRPKLVGPGEPAADFLVQDYQTHGLPGWINLFGIESPGLTASLSLAEHVADALVTAA